MSKERFLDLLGGGSQLADLLQPEGLIARLERRGWTGDVLRVDEDATRSKGGVDVVEQSSLVGVLEVVDGQ